MGGGSGAAGPGTAPAAAGRGPGDARRCVSFLWGLEDIAPAREGFSVGAGGRMEGQAAPGAGGGEEPLSSARMNPKRSGRAAEEESRNKPKLVSVLWGWERGRGRAGGEQEGGGGRRPRCWLIAS